MSPSLLDQSITARVATYTTSYGERVATYADTTLKAAVQPMRPSQAEQYGLEASEGAVAVYLKADPGLKAGDQILWGARSFQVLAPAQDQAGRGRVYMVPCREVR